MTTRTTDLSYPITPAECGADESDADGAFLDEWARLTSPERAFRRTTLTDHERDLLAIHEPWADAALLLHAEAARAGRRAAA